MPWAPEHRLRKNRELHAKRRKEKKDVLSDFTCISCHHPNPNVVEWHHLDPDSKEFGIAAGYCKSHDVWWNEVLKCVPLCANCHRLLHMNLLCLLPISPTVYKPQAVTASTSALGSTCRQ